MSTWIKGQSLFRDERDLCESIVLMSIVDVTKLKVPERALSFSKQPQLPHAVLLCVVHARPPSPVFSVEGPSSGVGKAGEDHVAVNFACWLGSFLGDWLADVELKPHGHFSYITSRAAVRRACSSGLTS